MKNNKGYMLYELIIAFVLTTIIIIFLLSTSFKLTDKNEELIVSSRMSIMQENFTSRFYEDANNSEYIYLIGSLQQGDTEFCKFDIGGKEVTFGVRKEVTESGARQEYIYYNGYEQKLPDGIFLKTPALKCTTTYSTDAYGTYDYETSTFHKIKDGYKNSAIAINVGITDNYANKDYDINIMYVYQNTDEALKYNQN